MADGNNGAASSSPGAAVSIGNYKGVMLCNRPFNGVATSALLLPLHVWPPRSPVLDSPIACGDCCGSAGEGSASTSSEHERTVATRQQ
jgi:hypothetical protein